MPIRSYQTIRGRRVPQWRLNESLDWFRDSKEEMLMTFDIEADTILQRLPEGMCQGDTLYGHMEKCVDEMTETHVFESSDLAEKFLSVRCPEFTYCGLNDDVKFYMCPLGENEESCSAYAKMCLQSDSHIVEICYLHYGHSKEVGQPRLTQIHFVLIRLFIDFYWKSILDTEWNVSNLVYCFKNWFSDKHTLHFINIHDIKAICKELGKPDLSLIDTERGVFHSERMSAEKRFIDNSFKPIWALKKRSPRPATLVEMEQDLSTIPYMNDCGQVFSSIRGQNPWQFQNDADTNVAIQSWEELNLFTTHVRTVMRIMLRSPLIDDLTREHLKEVFDMVNHFQDVAKYMAYRLKTANGRHATRPTYLGQIDHRSFDIQEPLFPTLYLSSYPNFYFPLKPRNPEDKLKVVYSAALYPLLLKDDTIGAALRDDAIVNLPGPSIKAMTPEQKMVVLVAQKESKEREELENALREAELELPIPIFIPSEFPLQPEPSDVQPQLTKNQKKKNKKKLKKLQKKEEQERQRLRDQPLRHYDP